MLGHVRGVVLLAGAEAGLPVHEFPPATVKQQVTGFGRAEKAQVAFMVTRILDLPERRPSPATPPTPSPWPSAWPASAPAAGGAAS